MNRSLEEVHRSVPVPTAKAGFLRQWFAYTGPALLVSVGYVDPGNWGTDLAAGARYKYGLLWVVTAACAMAMVMQILSARLGVVTGKDLAQCCRDHLPRWTRWPAWIAMEAAVAATDLAEALGSAVALNLLFGMPLVWAMVITALDVMMLIALQGLGMRVLEAVVATFVATIAGCYAVELFVLPPMRPDLLELGSALVRPGLSSPGMLVVAIGIVGATVMPHNLFLHSALVQTRNFGRQPSAIRRAIRFNAFDSVIALGLAFLVNAAILVLAALVFHGRDQIVVDGGITVTFAPDSDWIRIAHFTLAPLLGTTLASTLFAVALLASGQSSTITGTLAGQVVMEGFMNWRIRPWIRRLASRLLAVVPAIWLVAIRGQTAVTDLVNLSQVILCLLLPFAILPLVYFTSSQKIMGTWRAGRLLRSLAWAIAVLITLLNFYSLPASLVEAWRILHGP
jgi:manganese transport protein